MQGLPESTRAERKSFIYLLLSAFGVFVLFPQIVGIESVVQVIKRADLTYLVLALVAEMTRYLVSAGSTYVLARLFDRPAKYIPLVESFFAGTAANRTFSTGGAPGMIVRALFLMKQGWSASLVAALFLIEDVAGAMVGGIVLFIGALIYLNLSPFGERSWLGIVATFVVGVMMVSCAMYVYRRRSEILPDGRDVATCNGIVSSRQGWHSPSRDSDTREWVERVVYLLVRVASQMSTRLLGRALNDVPRLQKSLDDFYAALKLTTVRPAYALASFGLNVTRFLAGALALYFSFRALGWQLSVPALILLSTLFSLLTTISAAPAEVVIMGGGYTVAAFYFNTPKEITLVALLLSRALSFWWPIPIGYLAWWNLKRKNYL